MELLLHAVRAVAEPTRLRIANLCAHSELTVSDLVELLSQSQPRISRHLKLLVEGGILERHREGAWARYRLASDHRALGARFAANVLDLLPLEDPTLARDLDLLDQLRRRRELEAVDYFRSNAERWDRVRALHVDESEVSQTLLDVTRGWTIGRLLDVGTGTGKLLELFGPDAESAVGIDLSPAMLRVARAAVDKDELAHCQVRLADMYRIPWPDGSFDTAVLHMVLHFANDPGRALAEVSRALASNGRVVIVDFASHNLAELHTEHAHIWPGFSNGQIEAWLGAAGFGDINVTCLEGGALTVCIWTAQKAAQDSEKVA